MTFIASALMGVFLLSGAVAAVTPAYAQAPGAFAHTFSVHLTGYNAVPGQTDSTPYLTSIGAYSNPEVVAARSQDLASELPYGTIIAIEGPDSASDTCGYSAVDKLIGYRVIADAMNIKITNSVDILFSTKDNYLLDDGRTVNASRVLGSCDNVHIRVVGHVDVSNLKNIPKTQADLVALVEGKSSPVALR